MNHQTILCCVVALILGMLLAHMLRNVCGCKVVEGQCDPNAGVHPNIPDPAPQAWVTHCNSIKDQDTCLDHNNVLDGKQPCIATPPAPPAVVRSAH